jgi:hypothetical protein
MKRPFPGPFQDSSSLPILIERIEGALLRISLYVIESAIGVILAKPNTVYVY